MPDRPVAFYVHHHGSGHANRCKLMAEHWPTDAPIHIFTSATDRFADWPEERLHPLPLDVVPERDPRRDLLKGEVLHYAPVDVSPLQQRMAILANWIADQRPSLFIVDLSVEVALFVRLCGVRLALVRLHGHRTDPAHVHAFRLAHGLIAPFPPELEDAHTPRWVRRKSIYLGAFSRYDRRQESRQDCRALIGLPASAKVATLINGLGGGAQVHYEIESIAKANPDWTFLIVGRVGQLTGATANVKVIGIVEDTFPYLRAADVVVGSGGTNTMMEIGAARVPYLSRPEPRPFAEQACKMRALARFGLTQILPDEIAADDWTGYLAASRQQDVSGWDRLFEPRLEKALGEWITQP